MKLVMLETSPTGPLHVHRRFLRHKSLDYRFVTHHEPHPKAAAFRQGENWISNRNFLAASVPRRYDYYWFTDGDVAYTSQTRKGVVSQIIADLEKYHPAVMVCYDSTKRDYGEDTGEPRAFLMSNNQMKIIHHSLIDWFFPHHFWVEGAGQWENCHLQNVLEAPFRHHIMMTPNVHARGMVSRPASQPGSSAQGFANMQRMHDWIRPSFKEPMPSGATHREYKAACLADNRTRKLLPSPPEVRYDLTFDLDCFFDLSHAQFNHWTSEK